MKKIVLVLFVLLIAVPTTAFSQQGYYWEYYTRNGVQYKKKVFVYETFRAYIPQRQYIPPPVVTPQQILPQQFWNQYYGPTQYPPQPIPVVTADQGLGVSWYYNNLPIYNNYNYGNMNYYGQSPTSILVTDLLWRFLQGQQRY